VPDEAQALCGTRDEGLHQPYESACVNAGANGAIVRTVVAVHAPHVAGTGNRLDYDANDLAIRRHGTTPL
jgi:hypothetical protein